MSFMYYTNKDRQEKKPFHPLEDLTPQDQQPEQSQFPSPEELVKNIFSVKPPQPTFDKAKAYRLEKMARFNALGRGMSVLGDVLSLGLGANVRRRQPDTMSPAIYASFESMMDKYKNDQDAYRFALYQKQMQDAQLGISHGYRREDQTWREKAHRDELEATRNKMNMDFEKWRYDWEQRERKNKADAAYKAGDLNYKGEKLGADQNYRDRKLKQDWDLAVAKALADYWKDNTHMEVMVGGQARKLSEAEYRGLLSEARKDMKWSGTDFETMMQPYVNYPIEGLKNIVQRFSEYKYEIQQKQQQYSPENLSRQQPLIDSLVEGGSFNNIKPGFKGQIPLRDSAAPSTSVVPPPQDDYQQQLNTAPFDSTKYLRH